MQKSPVRPVVEGGVLTAIAILFAFISTYVPVLGDLVTLIWPVPIVLLGVRHGCKWSIMAVVASGILIALFMPPSAIITVVVGFGLIGIVLGYAMRQKFSSTKTLILGSIASMISMVARIVLTLTVLGFNPFTLQIATMSTGLEQGLEFYRNMGMKHEDLAQMEVMMRSMIDVMKIVFPASIAFGAIAITFINFQIAKVVLRRLGYKFESFPPFRHWTMPRITVHVLAVSFVAIYWGESRGIEILYNSGMNLQVAAIVLLFIQGMALVYFLTDKYNLSRIVRGIILFLILSNPIFMQALIIGGAFDLIFDYRQLRTPKME
ncbi:hypothetical protein SOV_52770 [Sporomusa ovata DSM 2662]|uniref:DUF2232 domain-containing protein n=1 Tax=Sporomusa ovata TaxID=2378 RepID=A0A0U1KRF7_9FIRM|nr:YybS family protein [Sporomusa ovata]EQB27645.1 hypothetical protein SOV_2c05460 [Sporomusa ovata DSM 2662]CQR69998.1 FIG003573: hypothetical protein [Sporomusa ovata]